MVIHKCIKLTLPGKLGKSCLATNSCRQLSAESTASFHWWDVSFAPDEDGIDGRTLEPACRDRTNPSSVSDEILRWHFRQSVLTNMRGSGEPVFETDFPPGTDQIKTLSNEPYGKERFEMEMDMRLRYSARDEQASSMIANRSRPAES